MGLLPCRLLGFSLRWAALSIALAAWLHLPPHQASGQLPLVYSFEGDLQGFAPNGGGVTVSLDTIGATEGSGSMKVDIVQGATFVGALTSTLPEEIGDPPGLDTVIFDLTLTEAFPAEGFVDAGITFFGASQPDDPNGQQFGLAVQFLNDQAPLGDLEVGTHEIRIDLTTRTHPLTFEERTFNEIFGTVGSGPDDLIPTGFQIYINKSANAPWTGYIDNIRVGTAAPPLDADFNDDAFVNDADLSIWKSGFAIDATGDADGDLDTDGADFLVWQQQFGSSPAIGAVPEPAAACLLAGGLGALLARRRSAA